MWFVSIVAVILGLILGVMFGFLATIFFLRKAQLKFTLITAEDIHKNTWEVFMEQLK